MKRTVLPVVILMAISVITVGMVIGASSRAKDQTNVMANSPADQLTDASATTQSRNESASDVSIIQLTPLNSTGNYRYPAVAEDSKGNRLVIFRGIGGKDYDYMYCEKGGTWGSPITINGGDQPVLEKSLYATIKVDSTDRFHCQWEEAKGDIYASFRDGIWTTPIVIKPTGRFDRTSALDVRSDDTVVTVDCEVLNLSKDVYIHVKTKNETKFENPFNLTRDPKQGSTQPCIAVDSKDNSWVVWKSDYHVVNDYDNLVIFLGMFLPNNKDGPIKWIICSPDPGWSFLPQVAVNSEDKVMVLSASTKVRQYITRLYNPATKKLSELISLNIGLGVRPWHMFYSRMVAHGKDFYAAVMTPQRLLLLMKFDEATSQWKQVAQVSDRNVEMFSLFSGYDKMLIAWNSWSEPSKVFLSTVGVDPYQKIRVKSVSNLVFKKQVERGFFHSYTLYALTWEANPDNIQKGVTVTAQRIYRKARTEDNTKWTRITQVSGTVLKYDDRNVSADSDYVYAVTCVDDNDHESKIY
jgi:hypothetical protein